MLNLAGILGSLECLIKPRLLIPTLHVRDIRCLDWKQLKRQGFSGVVIDKDNCITKPYHDALVPDLRAAWQSCLATFGHSRVLIVSNSAGTSDDPALIQAESVARYLQAPVLVHDNKKPSRKVARAIEEFFSSGQGRTAAIFPSDQYNLEHPSCPESQTYSSPLKLVVIGDRLTTDIVLASRLRMQLLNRRASALPSAVDFDSSENPVMSVLTQNIWQKEKLGTRFLRLLENKALKLATRHISSTMPFQTEPTPLKFRKISDLSSPSQSLLKRVCQSQFFTRDRVINFNRMRNYLNQKYDAISIQVNKVYQVSPSTILKSSQAELRNWISRQLDRARTTFLLGSIGLKSYFLQFLKSSFQKLKIDFFNRLAQSVSRIQTRQFEPITVGLKTPTFFQQLLRWRNLK